jgi:hypothetical protein
MCCNCKSKSEFPRVRVLELQSAARAAEIRIQHAVTRRERAVKEHMLDADVVVKVFDVSKSLQGARWMRV